MASSAAGGVTNTAQYQNRLMVYDPGQVTLHLCGYVRIMGLVSASFSS